MLQGISITLLVTGSIAAYKAAEVVRELIRRGARVQVAMTESAKEFITPLTLQTLTGNPVQTNMLDAAEEAMIGHIALADSADVVLVCPATANVIAKAAHGIADDIVTTVLLAARCPIVFAPAMNVNMWENVATKHNVQLLRERCVQFIEPTAGELACGWQGMGRLAEPVSVVEAVVDLWVPKKLRGIDVVVTAGPTEEPIDPVRFLSNRSTGKMGYAVAAAAKRLGAQVTLISGPTALSTPTGVTLINVRTASEMRDAVTKIMRQPLAAEVSKRMLLMAAAVSDHRPTRYSADKLKLSKSNGASLELSPNTDILKEISHERASLEKQLGGAVTIIGFAAETGTEEDLVSYARCKLADKGCDMIVGNLAEEALGSERNRIWLFYREGSEEALSSATKEQLAQKILLKASEL